MAETSELPRLEGGIAELAGSEVTAGGGLKDNSSFMNTRPKVYSPTDSPRKYLKFT